MTPLDKGPVYMLVCLRYWRLEFLGLSCRADTRFVERKKRKKTGEEQWRLFSDYFYFSKKQGTKDEDKSAWLVSTFSDEFTGLYTLD